MGTVSKLGAGRLHANEDDRTFALHLRNCFTLGTKFRKCNFPSFFICSVFIYFIYFVFVFLFVYVDIIANHGDVNGGVFVLE